MYTYQRVLWKVSDKRDPFLLEIKLEEKNNLDIGNKLPLAVCLKKQGIKSFMRRGEPLS
jgi:hypothetical protein